MKYEICESVIDPILKKCMVYLLISRPEDVRTALLTYISSLEVWLIHRNTHLSLSLSPTSLPKWFETRNSKTKNQKHRKENHSLPLKLQAAALFRILTSRRE
jgi:hypothetical protein